MISFYKKGRKIFRFLPFLLLIFSCAEDLSHQGRITLHQTSDKKFFVFSVNDEFLQLHSDSPKNKKFFDMSDAELGLLKKLLKQKQYCLNTFRKPVFTITSHQEKIYDITFAHLIEKNYNAHSVAPRMYFGQCQEEE
jgi:hypothetical protein